MTKKTDPSSKPWQAMYLFSKQPSNKRPRARIESCAMYYKGNELRELLTNHANILISVVL